ncbi:DUF2975 domain-containing protein [Cryobacterium sp. SO2]|uniref:DUF2975 domain-containing protein n=1 Tax=Cryobacterium sp. SO2 TaxID=1897060 RepID=UPI00223D0E07|nr:DUF2975 domain-containing protein [Cryobacterium sp. SO2]WEO75696.1 DUF2975 domain-containing protein [Cryobacterium sp. SO2]
MDTPPHDHGPNRSSSPITIAVARIVLGLLGVAIIIGEVVVVITAQSLAESYPEFAHLQVPLVTVALAFGVCVVVCVVVTGILLGSLSEGGIVGRTELRLVDVMIVSSSASTILVVAALTLIPGPPALALLLLAGALTGTAVALVLVVLRSALRGATVKRVELDEVV